jgi:hypothetical protein
MTSYTWIEISGVFARAGSYDCELYRLPVPQQKKVATVRLRQKQRRRKPKRER